MIIPVRYAVRVRKSAPASIGNRIAPARFLWAAVAGMAITPLATLHSFAAFIFNIGVLAFTINVLGG